MTAADPIALLYGGMAQLGPGSDEETARVLAMLPEGDFQRVVDAGCGTGRQTLALARELPAASISALDTFAPFLEDLRTRAAAQGAGHRIEAMALDMSEIGQRFSEVDLLWSEGAAYSIGFANALVSWRPALRTGGWLVASELSWLQDEPPAAAREFFEHEYPAMQSVDANLEAARKAGYEVFATHTLPRDAWLDGYYYPLAERARQLLEHPDAAVAEMAGVALKEVQVFEETGDSYGYVFFLLRKP